MKLFKSFLYLSLLVFLMSCNTDDSLETPTINVEADYGSYSERSINSVPNSLKSKTFGDWAISSLNIHAKKSFLSVNLEGNNLGSFSLNQNGTFMLTLDISKENAKKDITGSFAAVHIVRSLIKKDIRYRLKGKYIIKKNKLILSPSIKNQKPMEISFNETIDKYNNIVLNLDHEEHFPTNIGDITISLANIILSSNKKNR